jgi:hypothetical protein
MRSCAATTSVSSDWDGAALEIVNSVHADSRLRDGAERDALDADAAVAFDEIGDCVAKALGGVPFDAKARDVRMLDASVAGVIITGGVDGRDAYVQC